MKMSYVAVFTVQPATGPNLDGKKLEIVDAGNFRMAYVDNEDQAADEIGDALDSDGIWEGQVIREGHIE